MILKWLRIKNFRPFFGEQQISFSEYEQRNVTLVHAENGVGKTSLLSAVLWCFYGRLVEGVEQPEDILNHEAAARGENEYEVSVRFSHEAKEYEAVRKGFDSTNRLQVLEVTGRGFIPVPHAENFINGVVPSSMAGYFFFHGEGNLGTKGKNIRGAVRDILGFGFAELAVDDLDNIIASVRRDVTKHAKGSSLIQINDEIERAEEKAKEEKMLRDRLIKENAQKEARKRDLQAALRAVDNLRELQETREKLQAERTRKKKELIESRREELEFINKFGWVIFGDMLQALESKYLDDPEVKGKFPSPYYETFIKDLLDQGTCICGEDLSSHPQKQANVRRLLASAGTSQLIDRVSGARSKVTEIRTMRAEAPDQWRKIRASVRRVENELVGIERQVDEAEEKIDSSDTDEVEQIEMELKELENRLFSIAVALPRCRAQITELEERKKSLEVKSRQASAKERELMQLRARQDFIESVRDQITDVLDTAEESAIAEIESRMQGLMESISRKDYTPTLDVEADALRMVSNSNIQVGASTGERLLLNFVFISTLIQICRERASDSSELLIPGAIAPFVIDAPFGELDDVYKTETAKFLPQRAQQVIVFLSTSHWKGRIEKELMPYIGTEYVLISRRRQPDDGKRQKDPIEIRGKTVEQSVYGCEVDMTEIMEVDW